MHVFPNDHIGMNNTIRVDESVVMGGMVTQNKIVADVYDCGMVVEIDVDNRPFDSVPSISDAARVSTSSNINCCSID